MKPKRESTKTRIGYNDSVRVVSGPMTGLTGRVQEVGRHNFIVDGDSDRNRNVKVERADCVKIG